jgi:hypothetical protein
MLATLHKGLRRHSWQALTLLLALALVGVVLFRYAGLAHAGPRYDVPHNAQMEAALGVRFTQAALVCDTGLVELRYVVLDAQKASAFQNDTAHPPLLRNERTSKTGLAGRADEAGARAATRPDVLPAVPQQQGRGSARRQE